MVNQNQSRIWGWVGAIVAAVLVIWGISSIRTSSDRTSSVDTTPPANDMATPGTANIPDSAVANNPAIPPSPDMTAPGGVVAPGTTGTVEYVLNEDSDFDTNPDKYIGATISVEGEINDVIGEQAHAFTVDTDGAIGGDEVLVLTKAGTMMPVEKGNKIRVVGVGRKLLKSEVTALESELGHGLDNDLLNDFDEKIVIIANSVGASAH